MEKRTVNIVTLGCSKNLVDSEHLLKQFEANDFEVLHDANTASEIVIVNTCGFILDAKEESIATIMDFIQAKNDHLIDKLYVMGCLSARYMDELKNDIPEVDRFFGKFDFEDIIDEIKLNSHSELKTDRVLTTPSHYAYLKISEGCNRNCSFCAIPQFTGKHVSVPIEELVEEAQCLAEKGVKELLLIAQDLSFYGYDLYKESRLADLVNRLSLIEGIEWIRLHYAYPTNFPVDVLKVMKENPKVCAYLDIPFQHISTNMLSRMKRNITKEETLHLIDQIRNEVPGIAIRTTLLVGFPGETEDDFNELMELVRDAKFDRLGVFPYSHEDDTHAWKYYSDDVDENLKQERADQIMELQQGISETLTAEKIGQTLKVIVDRLEGDHYIGRTEFDSPEVDGEVLISSSENLIIGSFYEVKITSSYLFDLYGTTLYH